ncbi:hypothetical protein H3019_gp25 [Bacillus phage Karezi]|uniref:Uncharacterized protein n=1 Tax=Bacillus phage Karezi TaxID=2591398 RepID=A0A514AAQ1_9CAUD|nr:hypothetical protein H3019_gp25 [Bacillus phage Karezi]QDH50346.1 hypothetical protein KAREZI_25 [Bacillus phage Karezi]
MIGGLNYLHYNFKTKEFEYRKDVNHEKRTNKKRSRKSFRFYVAERFNHTTTEN